VDLSILIPTYRRPEKLRRCLESLAAQRTAASFEVIVGVDGDDGGPTAADIPESIQPAIRVERFPKIGYIAIRRRMLEAARGRIFLSMNDDVEAAPDLVQRHLEAHASDVRVVGGIATWKPVQSPTLFDQLVQQTNLIFFAPRPDRAPTYRDCYGLNMSAPTSLARAQGGFPDIVDAYGYDDIELAYRLIKSGATLALAPTAAVVHDHRYTTTDVLRREYLLGRSAWTYADVNPEFSRDLFGRSIRDRSELDHAERFIEREHRDALRIQSRFLSLADTPPLPDGPDTNSMLAALADSWILLKRYLWRQGLLAASRNEPNHWSLLA
jgi:GT2 family glycosyltransferase